MIKIIILVFIPLMLFSQVKIVEWGEVIDTEAEHLEAIVQTDNEHFDSLWVNSGGINNEGYMRFFVREAVADDDGYWLQHPDTTLQSIYGSYLQRFGGTFANYIGDTSPRDKWILFYNDIQANPRPMVVREDKITGGSGTYFTFGVDTIAGGNGWDEFGESDPNTNYPDHTFRIFEDTTISPWYWVVAGLVNGRIQVWIYSRNGDVTTAITPLPAQLWVGENWQYFRGPMAFMVETTDATGDTTAFVDVGHLKVTYEFPTAPTGFYISNGKIISGGIGKITIDGIGILK